jgi:hypothetical protein
MILESSSLVIRNQESGNSGLGWLLGMVRQPGLQGRLRILCCEWEWSVPPFDSVKVQYLTSIYTVPLRHLLCE